MFVRCLDIIYVVAVFFFRFVKDGRVVRDPCCCLFILFGGCKAHILPVIIEDRRPTTALRSMAENTKVHDNT